MSITQIDGILLAKLLRGGAAYLRANASIVNDLNVFPIPDGDTGENMCLTLEGGVGALERAGEDIRHLGQVAALIAGGMLMSARGNSGVILSQLAAGVADGLDGLESANTEQLIQAFRSGVSRAYEAVMRPTEGTILTVFREATESVANETVADMEALMNAYIRAAHASLEHTPDLLACLKEAGVVDSGGAGLCYIAEGMYKAMRGEEITGAEIPAFGTPAAGEPNYDLFDENSVMEFGYCTEFLLRLQRAKTDPDAFDLSALTSYLETVGDSIVAFRTGTVVKVHVHTMVPGEVLSHCQRYGEFLKLKIENMTIQHSESVAAQQQRQAEQPSKPRKAYGVVAVASGEGIRETFLQLGADEIVDGGQTHNPSAEDFLEAFRRVNADTILVFPNNGNILLAARQAAELYDGAEVRVLESKTIGDGYAALTMLDFDSGDTDLIVQNLTDAMQGVVTGMVTYAVRDTCLNGIGIHTGDYIGFVEKEMLSAAKDPVLAAEQLLEQIGLEGREVLILICGKDCTQQEAEELHRYVAAKHPATEVFRIDGGQDVYRFILIAE